MPKKSNNLGKSKKKERKEGVKKEEKALVNYCVMIPFFCVLIAFVFPNTHMKKDFVCKSDVLQ